MVFSGVATMSVLPSKNYIDLSDLENHDLIASEVWENLRLWSSGLHHLELGELFQVLNEEVISAPVFIRDGLAASIYLDKLPKEKRCRRKNFKTVAQIVLAAYKKGWHEQKLTPQTAEDVLSLPVGLLYDTPSPGTRSVNFRDFLVLEAAGMLMALDKHQDLSCQAEVLHRIWTFDPLSPRFCFVLPKYCVKKA